LLDSYAVLALLNDEPGAEAVAEILREAARDGETVLINEINVGEIYYIVAKARSESAAERVLQMLETLPLEFVGNAFVDVMTAARIKARHPISYADAFAVDTALRYGARIVTGDREFESVTELVSVEWI
jgi:predicted nucleic acid-binding protein